MKERNQECIGPVDDDMLPFTEMEQIVRGTRSELSGNRAIGLEVHVDWEVVFVILKVEAEARKVHLCEVEGCTCCVERRAWIRSPLVAVQWRTGREEAHPVLVP